MIVLDTLLIECGRGTQLTLILDVTLLIVDSTRVRTLTLQHQALRATEVVDLGQRHSSYTQLLYRESLEMSMHWPYHTRYWFWGQKVKGQVLLYVRMFTFADRLLYFGTI